MAVTLLFKDDADWAVNYLTRHPQPSFGVENCTNFSLKRVWVLPERRKEALIAGVCGLGPLGGAFPALVLVLVDQWKFWSVTPGHSPAWVD